MVKAAKKRTTETLRDILFDEIDTLRGKDGDPERARTVAKLSREILSTAKLEMQFQEMNARLNERGVNVGYEPLALGSK